MNSGIDKTLMRLLVYFGLFFFVTMPGWICPGDAYVSRAESANIVMNRNYGIDYSLKQQLGDFAVPDIMIFNGVKSKIYSWYGIVNTAVYLPVNYAMKLIAGKVDLVDNSLLYIFFINLNNIAFSLIIIYYLYKLTGIYSNSEWQKVLFVVLSVFSTNLWFYLKSQHHEIFQITAFVGFVYYFVLFLRNAEIAESGLKWKYLKWSAVWLALLFLTKVYYLTVVAVAMVFCLLSGNRSSSYVDRIKCNLRKNAYRIFFNFVIILLIAFFVALLVNKIRTGMFLSTGYASKGDDFQSEIAFSFDALAQSIPGLLIKNGNCNLFYNYPVVFFAFFGMVTFFKRKSLDSVFIIFVVWFNIFVLACFHGWDGGMSYGPRYYLPFLMVGSLPFLDFINYISSHLRNIKVFAVAIMVSGVFLLSIYSQICVNSIGNFACWFIGYKFQLFNDKEIDDYFSSGLTRANVYRDIVLFRSFGGKFPPLELAKNKYIPVEDYAKSESYLNTNFDYDFMVLRILVDDRKSANN